MELKDKYINLFTDFGFKKVFGTEANKDLLTHFLNTVLEGEIDPITQIRYGKQEFLSKRAKDRKAIFDLYCESDRGDKFIIELQRAEQAYFKDRSIYYASFPIQEQGKRGDWDYELLPVYTVAIMDFEFPDSTSDKVISYVKLREKDNPEPFSDKLAFIYIEMPKFLKQSSELVSILDKWLYVFKHLHELEKMPQEVQEGVFLKLFKQCEIANYSPKESMKYKESWKIYNDNKNVMDFAIAKATEKAIAKGLQEGFEQGIERGIEQGIVGLIKQGMLTNEQIAIAMGVGIQAVKELRKNTE